MRKLDIVYEDKNIIVINKDAKLLTISTTRGNDITLYSKVYDYLHKKNQKVFIVHRLDKDTSGLIIMAKNEQIKKYLQENWSSFTKEYIAVVEGKPSKNTDILKNYLYETKGLDVKVSNNKKGTLAISEYTLINKSKSYSLLKVNIKTGKRNQIRCQLSFIGNPIIGDKKYHAKTNPLRRLGLHASRLVIKIYGKEMEFVSSPPDIFINMFKKNKRLN